MLNSTHKSNEILKHTSLATTGIAVAAGAFMLDQIWGFRGNTKRRSYPTFHPARLDQGQHTIGVLPGCQTNSRLFFQALDPLTPNSKLIVTDYPEHTFNIEAICENLSKRLIAARAEKPSLLNQSMGGIVMRHFLHYAEQMGVAEKLGGFGSIVLDSSPFDYADVRKGSKRLATAASLPVIRTSRTVDLLKPPIYGRIAGKMSAAAHLDTIRAETMFMQQSHPDGPLPDVMDNVFYIHGPYDHVVNTATAAPRYEAITPFGKFNQVLHEARPYGDHTVGMSQLNFVLAYAGVETPELSMAA
jgi:hypothetical protein